MPPPHHSIYIHFIRRTANGTAQTDSRLDDTLQIQKLMTYQKLIHYLYRVFWMLSLDEDPFQSVQFIVPGYPTTLIRVDSLRGQLAGVMDILTATMFQWPTIARPEAGEPDAAGARRDVHLASPTP